MFKATRTHILLLLIFVFAFAYRIILMLWSSYPPGADIGLHNSVINSITQSGNTNFLWNNYQMGGGLSLTFPGYHIFASGIIMMTGMSDYIAQAVIAALFSSLIVLCAYLITKSVWIESGALIVAFLVAISRPDLEILLWGGYPNVITLLLIPVTFYLYLQKDRFKLTPFLVSTSILVGSIYLTHSLSAAVFGATTVATVLLVMISPKTFNTSRKHVFYWLLPLFLGAVLVAPFLVKAIPAYLSANSSFVDISSINSALLSTRVLPLTLILPLFACTFLFFFLSKEYRGRFLSLPAFLLFMWLLVPTILTQGFLFGLYVDYNRFLYFLVLPVLILIGMFIERGSSFFAYIIDNYRVLNSQVQKPAKKVYKNLDKVLSSITRKTLYAAFIVIIVLICLFALPLFITPWQGNIDQSFYQVMDNPGFQAIQWAKQNTPANTVFVSDALYGWWFGGFAQRPTLSAVDPQYLTLAREFEPAKFAKNVLDTDYMIDNGYIQVREDGGYIGRHNPMFLADLNWTYFPYSFLQFNNSEITLLSQNGLTQQSNDITQIPVTSMQLIGAQTDNPSIIVNKVNSNFSYSEILTVTKGVQFANMTIMLQSNSDNISLNWLNFVLNSEGKFLQPNASTVAMLDTGTKEVGQLVFAQNQPQVSSYNSAYPCITQLSYNLQGKSSAEIQILIGIYPISDNDIGNPTTLNQTLLAHEQNPQKQQENAPSMDTFDYQAAMQQYSVSYVVNRDFELNPKFANDPKFSLVFINSEIAIFKVKGNDSIGGS
jgi:DNA-binding transcriptional regulator of glucitol operon